MADKKLKKIDFQLQAIIGNIIFSDTEVWAMYDIPTTIYDFLSNDKKVAYSRALTSAIGGLARDQDKVVDLYLLVTTSPIDINNWEERYLDMLNTQNLQVRSGFQKFIEDQRDMLLTGGYYEKRVYLGVKLGRRHELDTDLANPFSTGIKDAGRYLKNWFDGLVAVRDKSVTEEELKNAQAQENDYWLSVSRSRLQGERSTSEELALLIKRRLYPNMPVPYLTIEPGVVWGRGDMMRELGSIIRTKDPKLIEVEQIIDGESMVGDMATLTFSKFPDQNLGVPYDPWIYSSIYGPVDTPFDIYARMSLVPAKKIKGDIEKGIAQQNDAFQNAIESGSDPGQALQEDLERGRELQAQVSRSNQPWMSGTYRVVVTASNKEELEEECKNLISFYDERGIKLVWTFRDQLDLMLESMPGDHLRENSFIQTTNIEMLSASGFNIMNIVGDGNEDARPVTYEEQ